MKTFLLFIGIIIITLGVFCYIDSENAVIELKQNTISSIEFKTLAEIYIRENISDISDEKEVLGGKFYITDIIWLSDEKAEIKYEDGHIALIGVIELEYIKGKIFLKSFSSVEE